MNQSIGVMGLWHLGCVLCASWYKLGKNVVGFDYDEERIEKLNKGIPPLFEPYLAETIQEGLLKKSLEFSSNVDALSKCDFIFLSYDTPVLDDDSSDTSILEKSIKDVRYVMKKGAVLIVSSQSPVGFCTEMRNVLREKDKSLDLAYSPENLRLGEAIECYLNPGRIILGTECSEAEQKCKTLFSEISGDVLAMNLESAEMVKHGINSFLSTSIVFANHLADICELSGARIDDVVRGIKSDPRIGQKAYLSPGIGFSGGTLGRDLKVLDNINQNNNGYATLFGSIHRLNTERKLSIIRRVDKLLGGSGKHTIGVLGLTYKPGTSTLRRSLPLEIINLFIERGYIVNAYDPKADYEELEEKPKFNIASDIPSTADSADILILFTEWNDFKVYDWEKIPLKMNRPIFYDTKSFLDEQTMRSFGFEYYSVGK